MPKTHQPPRLGVNVDHIATLRQQRGELYPCPVEGANVSLQAGADQITIHLREDRRHIQDHDVFMIKEMMDTQNSKGLLNFEMGANASIIEVAKKLSPHWICLVPEKREEKTTEGGLDLLNPQTFLHIQNTCEELKNFLPQVKISLFIEANRQVIEKASECAIDAVEIHTGSYAIDFIKNSSDENLQRYFVDFLASQSLCRELGLGHHAGHGLTITSVKPLLEKNLFVEYNIGHAIISDAVFLGLHEVVLRYKTLMNRY